MSVIITLVIIVVWGYSYWKFRQRYSYFKTMVQYLEIKLQNAGDIEKGWVMVRLACAYQEIQHYKTAYNLYEKALQLPLINVQFEHVHGNMRFCMNPVPGVKGLKNFNCSYWHNFVLVRLGGRRMNFLWEDDFLQVNNMLRK